MKKNIILRLMIFFTISINAQDLNTLFTNAANAVKAKDIPTLKTAAISLQKLAPENYGGHIYLAFVNCLENDVVSAKKNLTVARNLNYLDASCFAIASYVAFLENDITNAKAFMNTSYALISYENALPETLKDIDWIQEKTGKDCSALKTIANTANSNNPNAIGLMKDLFASYPEWQKGNNAPKETSVYSYLSGIPTHGDVLLSLYKFQKSTSLFYANKLDQGAQGFEHFVNHPKTKNNPNFKYNLASAYNYLADYSHYNYNNENALNEANRGLQFIKGFKTQFTELSLLKYKLNALTGLNKKTQITNTANQLLKLAKSLNNEKYEAIASNALGQYYANSAVTTNRSKAYTYLSSAYTIANKLNDTNLISEIGGNYAISLWQKGNKTEAFNVTNKALRIREEKNDISGAQLLANNIGYMSYISKDYTNAIKMFKKSVNLAENHFKKVSPELQLTLMNEYSSAYSGLIMTYKDTNNKSALFKTQDANRSRLLSKKLNQNSSRKTIEEVQSKLNNSDVLIYYSLLGPGEMVATTVTKTTSKIHYNYPIDTWLRIKNRLLNRVSKKPSSINGQMIKLNEEIVDNKIISYNDKNQAFQKSHFDTFTGLTRELMESGKPEHKTLTHELLKQWYAFLITPLKNDIIGKKNLIISGEGALNYLPFEAFIDSNNKFLIENHNISYIPSASVWAKLKTRNYSASRKNLLAMGGATYKSPNASKNGVRTAPDYYKLKKDLASKINTNKNNLSNELTAFGFGGANYLEGTLKEVQNLKKIVTDATILTGPQMKESIVKSMNNSNELANYKWLHIATHGFALDDIPALSGVMMTQSDDEKTKGEDTFLLAHEIEKLNLNADLVVLSACQTALGKVYNGEGINGLNSSLMAAGANNTLLSLWPVNDAGTMILMTLIYQNMVLKGLDISDATTNAKRTMLSGKVGDAFKSVYMWAPFVLNGLGK